MIFAMMIFYMVVYIAILIGALYFCMIADPNESPWAEYFTLTLPSKIWGFASRLMGERGVTFVEIVTDRLLLLIYSAVMFGAWSVVFGYVYPWIDRQTRVPSYHKWIGYLVFLACVSSWRLASITSPGIITSKSLKRFDHYPYDNILFLSSKQCSTRKIPKLARSKFDRIKYCNNVGRFDHYCGWVYNTIGEENYRYFLLFLLIHVGMCSYGTYVLSQLFFGEILDKKLFEVTFVDRMTGIEFKATKWIAVQYLLHNYVWEAGVWLLVGVMTIALGLFLAYHCYLTSFNLTTNEAYKWSYINKWYKEELKLYQKAVKNGTAVVDFMTEGEEKKQEEEVESLQPSSSSRRRRPPQITDDGDVACTPGTTSKTDQVIVVKEENESSTNDEHEVLSRSRNNDPGQVKAVRHPGPKPRNIYNRGFVENWKEVIFPISLRKDRSIQGWSLQTSKVKVKTF